MWIVIDEASRFISSVLRFRADLGPPLLQDQAQTMRKRGLFLLAATQSISEMPVSAMANFSTKIIFRTSDGTNLRYLKDLLSLNPEQTQYLAALPERRALLSFPFWPKPLVIDVPEMNVPNVSRERIKEIMEPVLANLKWVPVDAQVEAAPKQETSTQAETRTQPESTGNGSMLSYGEMEYLIEAAKDPFMAVTARDKKSGIALGTGAAMRKRLVKAGYLILHRIKPLGRGGETTLTEITQRGWDELQKRKVSVHKPSGRGGFRHVYFQEIIRRWLEAHYKDSYPRIEAMVNGKAIDCLATINGRTEAFELVMNGGEWASRVKELSNAEKDIEMAGVAKVHICAEDYQTLARIRELVQRECGDGLVDMDKISFRLLAEFL